MLLRSKQIVNVENQEYTKITWPENRFIHLKILKTNSKFIYEMNIYCWCQMDEPTKTYAFHGFKKKKNPFLLNQILINKIL